MKQPSTGIWYNGSDIKPLYSVFEEIGLELDTYEYTMPSDFGIVTNIIDTYPIYKHIWIEDIE